MFYLLQWYRLYRSRASGCKHRYTQEHMELIFQRKIQESATIYSFIFVPTAPLTWIAGQSLRLEMPTLYGPEDHRFTIASAPSTGEVVIATRLSQSMYKQSLASLRPGDTVQAYGLEGSFVWEDTPRPRLFIAAGVGITPFYSILAERLQASQPIPATLLYSSPDDPILYAAHLQQWQQTRPEFTLQLFAGQRLNGDNIIQTAPNLTQSEVYISGPTRMVDILSKSLLEDYHLPEVQLHRDWFTGQLSPEG
jgi:ferredoxin-NADP reductase